MKKLIGLMLLLGWAGICQAQFAVINDPDGYTNVREEESSDSRIVDKVFEHEPIYVSEENISSDMGWLNVLYTRRIQDLNEEQRQTLLGDEYDPRRVNVKGYIHSSRVKSVSQFPSLKKTQITPTLLTFSDGQTTFLIQTGAFDPREHKIEPQPAPPIEKIDGEYIVGTDYSMPTSEIKWIRILDGKKEAVVSPTSFQYMYQPNVQRMRMTSDEKGRFFLIMSNSDGGGSYDACLVFLKGKVVAATTVQPY